MKLARDMWYSGTEDTLVEQQEECNERHTSDDHEESETRHMMHRRLCRLRL
jgi:hypothetical protein